MPRQKKPRPIVTVEEIKSWGVWTSLENAGRAFGMSRSVAYDLKRRGKFPVPIVMVGRRIVVPVRPILEKFLVGADVDDHTVDDDDQREPPDLRVVAP